MYRWIVKQLTRFALARLRRGDARIFLALAADDLHFRFLGQHSWAADYRSKDEVRRWLQRYLRARLELQPREIVVSGPPWNTIVCTRFSDRATNESGSVIYENEGVLFDRLRWGRIREHVSYEDTQRTREFDRKLGIAAGDAPDRERDPAAPVEPRGNPEPDEGAVEHGEEQIEKVSGN